MTDATLAKDDSASFWARVRKALGGAKPGQAAGSVNYGSAALARSMGIKPRLGPRIDEELAAGWTHAAARRVSISLLVIEIDRLDDYFTAYGHEDCVPPVMQAIIATLPRPGDVCLRLGRSSFVLVLPDLPVLMARALAAKIAEAVRQLNLANKASHAGAVTISMGLAVSNPQGSYDRRFFETAAEALKKAQRKGLGRLEAVDLRPAQEHRRKAA